MTTRSTHQTASTTSASLTIVAEKRDVRTDQVEAARILRRLKGMTAREAHECLRFRAGLVSAPLSRVIEQGMADARRRGIDEAKLAVGDWSVTDGETIRRLRRMAHGMADWIDTETTAVTIELTVQPMVEGWEGNPSPGSAGAPDSQAATGAVTEGALAASTSPAGVIDALREVIDPDLGVNIVDLGFVRGVRVEGRTAHLDLTLTNPFCPVTSVITDQVRLQLVAPGEFEDVIVNWVFDPPWSTDDITPDAREELRAIGFAGM